VIGAASAEAYNWVLGKYDTDNTQALRRLISNGAQLRAFSNEILEASYKAAYELFDEYSAKNPKWKKIYEPFKKFLVDEHQWFKVAEYRFDDFMYRHTPKL
jgi:TRAP-type mannitol/chloroaromatic compound transport system substrate-binding protein